MARRSRQAMVVELPENETEELPEKSEEEKLADDIIDESRRADPKNPHEIVKMVDPTTGDEGWVGQWSVGTVNPEFLARRFGKGTFVCYTRKPNATGKMVYAGSRKVVVSVDLREKDETPTSAGGGDFSRDLLLSMMKQSTENAQTMVTMMTAMMTAMTGAFQSLKPAPPTTDPLLLTIVQGMMQRKDPMEIAAEMSKAFKPENTDLLAQLRTFAEVRTLFSGDDGHETNELDLVAKGLDTVRALAGGARPPALNSPAAGGVESVRTEGEGPAKLVPAAVQPVTGPEWWMAVAPNVPQLLQASAIMPPPAAAMTLQGLLQSGGYWPSLVEDVASDFGGTLPMDPDENFGAAFASRTMQRVTPGTLTESVKPWVQSVLTELAYLTLPELPELDEDEAPDPEPISSQRPSEEKRNAE